MSSGRASSPNLTRIDTTCGGRCRPTSSGGYFGFGFPGMSCGATYSSPGASRSSGEPGSGTSFADTFPLLGEISATFRGASVCGPLRDAANAAMRQISICFKVEIAVDEFQIDLLDRGPTLYFFARADCMSARISSACFGASTFL